MSSPFRVVNQCERTTHAEPCAIINVPAATSTKVLIDLADPTSIVPNINTDLGMEIAARYLFNDTGAVLWYAFGQTCDNVTNYHGKMANQQQLDVSNYGGPVYVYSVGGGNVVPTVIHRQDLFPHYGQAGKPARNP